MQKIELRPIAEETGFVDRQIFEQGGEFVLPFAAGQQAIVVVEGIDLAGFETALQTILEKVRAALVEEHAAFLIDERLKELQLRFG